MIEIQPLEAADVPAKNDVELEAFASHPRMPMMWPRGLTPDLHAYQEASDLDSLRDETSRMFKAVNTDDGKLVGSACWTLALDPDAVAKKEPTDPQTPPPANWPSEGNWAMRLWYKINLEKLLERYLPGQRYIRE